jgi:hypothetical protein
MATYRFNFLMDCGEESTITSTKNLTQEEEDSMLSKVLDLFSRGSAVVLENKSNQTLVVNMAKVQSYLVVKTEK